MKKTLLGLTLVCSAVLAANGQPKTETSGGCRPKAEIFGGYSYLNTDWGDDRESMHGLALSGIYNINQRFGAGADFSIHSKKLGTQTLTRSFIGALVQVKLADDGCDTKLIPFLKATAGLGSEKWGNSKGHGFAFGACGGMQLKLNKIISLGTEAGYLGVKYDNTAKINNNVRAAITAIVKLQRRNY